MSQQPEEINPPQRAATPLVFASLIQLLTVIAYFIPAANIPNPSMFKIRPLKTLCNWREIEGGILKPRRIVPFP